MRKFICVLLLIATLLTLSACNWGLDPDETVDAPPMRTTPAPETTSEPPYTGPIIDLPPVRG